MSEVAKKELPENWAWATFGDIADLLRGVSYKKPDASSEPVKGKVPVLRANNIGYGLNYADLVYVPEKLIKDEQYIKKGDIIIAMSSGSKHLVGKAAQANEDYHGAYGAFCANLRVTGDIDPKYVAYYYSSQQNLKLISDSSKGSNINNLKREHVLSAPIPVAPHEQQKRIVAKIEELFSHIDAGIEALKKAKQLLKQYRQSVLKAAVTGELTKEWRETNKHKLEPASQLLERILKERRQKWEEQQLEQFKAKGKMPKNDKWKVKYKEPSIPDASDLPEIPEEWLWVTMGALCDKITDGTHHSPPNGPSGEYKYITAKNIKPWKVDLKKITYVSKKVHDEIYSRCDVRKGDVLYIKDGATTGIAALNKLDEEFSLLSSVGVLRFPTECFGEYFVSALNSPLIMDILLSKVAGVAITRLTLTKLNEGFITLPPVEEQKEIVRLVEEKLSSIEHLDLELDQQLIKAERNKQSVLASAFSGRLQ